MTVNLQEFWTFLIVLARVSALSLSAPIFGSRLVPAQVKIGLAAVLSIALVPTVAGQVGAPPADLFGLLLRLAGEVAIGICLGMIIQLFFVALQVGGHLIDSQAGFGIINLLNPYSELHNSVLGQFLYQLGMVLFLTMGGHLFLIGTLARSYATIAPGAATFSGSAETVFLHAINEMFVLAFRLAIPVVAVTLVIDVAFGIMGRMVPQMHVFLVGIPVKIIVGLVTLAVALPALAIFFGQMLPVFGDHAQSFLRAAR